MILWFMVDGCVFCAVVLWDSRDSFLLMKSQNAKRVLHDLSNYQKSALKEDAPIQNILIMMQIQEFVDLPCLIEHMGGFLQCTYWDHGAYRRTKFPAFARVTPCKETHKGSNLNRVLNKTLGKIWSQARNFCGALT